MFYIQNTYRERRGHEGGHQGETQGCVEALIPIQGEDGGMGKEGAEERPSLMGK